MTEKKSIDDMREQVERVKQSEAESLPPADDSPGEKKELSTKYVLDCLWSNELGDGLLYSALLRGQYIYAKKHQEWYRWTGHHWALDVMDEAAVAVDQVVAEYSRVLRIYQGKHEKAMEKGNRKKADSLDVTIKAIRARLKKIQSNNGSSAVLIKAHTNRDPLAVEGDEFDTNPWLLACNNGVIDLMTGTFRAGRQDDYVTKACPIEWQGDDADTGPWEQALLDIFNGDQEMVDYLHRLFGYAITGLSTEHIFPVFNGQGRNGKSMIVEVVSSVLGDMAGPIHSSMLLDQGRAKNSSGASADVMSLRGLRMAFASETDEGRQFSAAQVKWLTGGDKMVGRNPYDKRESRFLPTHTLVLLTNHRPKTTLSDDFAFWQRMHLVPFELSFVDNPTTPNERQVDKNLKEKLLRHKSGILTWLVKGCQLWQEKGLSPPEKITKATEEYRRQENRLAEWIDDRCVLHDDARAKSAALYENFVDWYKTNHGDDDRQIGVRKFGELLFKRFERIKSGGINHYVGIGLKARDGEG